jgi:hypothetical protein
MNYTDEPNSNFPVSQLFSPDSLLVEREGRGQEGQAEAHPLSAASSPASSAAEGDQSSPPEQVSRILDFCSMQCWLSLTLCPVQLRTKNSIPLIEVLFPFSVVAGGGVVLFCYLALVAL